MRRTVISLALALLVVLAGCSGQGTDGTAAPGDGTATSTPTVSTFEYPPGATGEGFENVTRLAERHAAILGNVSYTQDYRFEVLDGADAGQHVQFHTTSTANATNMTVRTTSEWLDNTSMWADGAATVSRIETDEGSIYSYVEGDGHSTSLSADSSDEFVRTTVGRLLVAFEYDAVETHRESGHDFVTYETTGLNATYIERSDTRNFTAANMTVVVRQDGLITRVEGTSTVDTDDGTIRRNYRYELTDLGSTTASEPAWVDDRVPVVDADVVGDGRVLKITHDGGPPLEPSEGMTVVVAGYGQVQLSPLAAGESVYLTAKGDGYPSNLTVHEQQPVPGGDAIDFTESERVLVYVITDAISYHLVAHVNASTAVDGRTVLPGEVT